MTNNIYPLKATEGEDTRAALNEMRTEQLRVAYNARRDETVKADVPPEVQDVTGYVKFQLPEWLKCLLFVAAVIVVMISMSHWIE